MYHDIAKIVALFIHNIIIIIGKSNDTVDIFNKVTIIFTNDKKDRN